MSVWVWSCVGAIGAEWPSIDEPLRTGRSAPDDAAVVVGIESYPFLTDVPYAQRDAAAFHDLLVYTRGVPLRRIHHLRGASNHQMADAVAKAAAEVGPDGVLWIYFAGHGAGDPDTGERLWVGDTAKADPASFQAGSLPLAKIEALAAAAPGEVVIVADACYNGLGRDGAQHSDRRFAVPSYLEPPEPHITRWFAAGPAELAAPLAGARHGAFTYFVIGAMRGWADGELGSADGAVSLAEADAFVVRALAEVGERGQRPELTAGGEIGPLVAGQGLEADPRRLGAPREPEPPREQATPHEPTEPREPAPSVPARRRRDDPPARIMSSARSDLLLSQGMRLGSPGFQVPDRLGRCKIQREEGGAWFVCSKRASLSVHGAPDGATWLAYARTQWSAHRQATKDQAEGRVGAVTTHDLPTGHSLEVVAIPFGRLGFADGIVLECSGALDPEHCETLLPGVAEDALRARAEHDAGKKKRPRGGKLPAPAP